ncbi:MAG TPA: hypothetical protein VE987_06640, partial [Polyangiaceae bacterium]|nr:hypothetical protein [Polyangiaceae bacterium]
MRTVAVAGALVLGAAAGLYAACQPTLDLGTNTARLDFDSNAIVVAQDGTPTQLTLRLGGDAQGAGSRLVAELPGGLNGLEYAFVHASGDAMGTVTFHVTATDGGPPPVAAGTYTVKLHVETAGTATDALPLPVTIAPVAHVQPGDGGTLREFVSTSLQPAYFQQSLPDPGALHALTSAPIHVQVFDSPWQGATERPDDSVWNFNELDRVLAPLLARGDSVELQIYAPPALTGDGVNGSFDFAAHEDVFAAYCANIVRYYNHQGLLWDGGVVQPDGGVAPFDGGTVTSSQPGTIRWWSILSDCNNNGNFPQTCPTWSQYPQVYNAAAAAMRRADPTIKLLALEANDGLSGGSQATPAGYLASFFVSPDAGGFDPSLVDSVAVHMFATTVAST